MKSLSTSLTAICFFLLLGCQSQKPPQAIPKTAADTRLNALRLLSTAERTSDFDQLLTLFKSYYGPYAYKEANLGIKLETLAANLKAKAILAKTDEEFAGYIMQFAAALKDGHVQFKIENTASGIARYKIPILLTPIEGRAIIADIKEDLKSFSGLSIGDEVLEIDGLATFSLLPTILKYSSMARDLSNQHLLAYVLSRPSYMTDLVPTAKTARLKAKTAAGEIITVDFPWVAVAYNKDLQRLIPNQMPFDLHVPFADELNSVVDGHIGQMGQTEPFFLTSTTQSQFKFVRVYPSDAARKKFGLKDTEKPDIYAALYKYQGKTIFLVRQATYAPSGFTSPIYLKAYQALFYEYQDLADVMVLDQTHNPGGSYCADFYNLFAQDGDTQGAEVLRADRKWINELKVTGPTTDPAEIGTWDSRLSEAWGLLVEKAYDHGDLLSEPIPLFSGAFYAQKQAMTWTKPMLVLIDELAGSCGDMFPMLVRANHRAKMFGQNTMGLGGNVEEVGILANSRVTVKLTRGMFYPYRADRAPTQDEFIENHGIAPDYVYNHTVSDLRAGYFTYVKSFSDKALEQISPQ